LGQVSDELYNFQRAANTNSAICIIQDDPGEKTQEIRQMASVYTGASLTIVASRPATTQEGFLQDRCQEAKKYGQGFELPFRYRNGIKGPVNLHLPVYETDTQQEPLETRAWALQERFCDQESLSLAFNKHDGFVARRDTVLLMAFVLTHSQIMHHRP
jgi:hypothetical protein